MNYYNSHGDLVMSWKNPKKYSSAFAFDLEINYSLFQAYLPITIEREQIKKLQKDLQYLYERDLRLAIDYCVEWTPMTIRLVGTEYGKYDVNLLLHTAKSYVLEITYCIDQSFFPEIIEGLKTLEEEAEEFVFLPSPTIEEAQEVSIQPTYLRIIGEGEETYAEIALSINNGIYFVQKPFTMCLKKLNEFRTQLSLWKSSPQSDTIVFSPLGEFINIEFEREAEHFYVRTDICDLLMPHSRLHLEGRIKQKL